VFVDEDRAGLELLRDCTQLCTIGAPDRGTESVIGVVRPCHRILELAVAHDRQRRTELFLIHEPHAVLQAAHQRDGVEITGPGQRLAPEEHLATVSLRILHQLDDLAELPLVLQRTQARVLVHAIPHGCRAGNIDKRVADSIVKRVVHVQALQRRAGLPGIDEGAPEHWRDERLDVRIRQDDSRIVAAEFEGEMLEGRPGARHHLAARRRRAGKHHFLDLRVLRHRGSEFVIAGDNLVSKCPTWSWESGEPNKRKSYLPPEKQFLITRNVPCLRRAASVEEEYEAAGGEVLLDNEDNDGWLATHGKPKDKSDEAENLPSMETLEISSKNKTVKSIPSHFGDQDEEDIPDMADYEEPDNIETDAATLPSTYLVAEEPDDDNILRTRTYDVSITYDKYYQTPRVWLTGYDESRMLLQPELVLEDVSQDHARKTVTIEDHPHLPGKHASVHPCRHGAVMKKIIDVLMSHGVEPEVDKYLFLFLKFVASVIPTIEYDYTMDFDLGSSSN